MESKDIIVACLLGIFVLGIVSLQIWSYFDDEKRDDYCLGLYSSPISEPSVFGNSWSESSGIENGYIRCCRYFYENHEKQKECQIFPYKEKEISPHDTAFDRSD